MMMTCLGGSVLEDEPASGFFEDGPASTWEAIARDCVSEEQDYVKRKPNFNGKEVSVNVCCVRYMSCLRDAQAVVSRCSANHCSQSKLHR